MSTGTAEEGGLTVLVCGGRHYHDRLKVQEALFRLKPSVVVTGDAGGADMLARYWCVEQGVPCLMMPAPWGKHGRAAGPIRNEWMIRFGRPNYVLAFPGGKGTADMRRRAEKHGIEIIEGDTEETGSELYTPHGTRKKSPSWPALNLSFCRYCKGLHKEGEICSLSPLYVRKALDVES
jgi:hypothetical protein